MAKKKDPKAEKPAKAAASARGGPKAKAAPRKRAGAARKGTATGSWRRFVVLEAATWIGGLAVGVLIVCVVLWGRARKDVEAFLADPSRSHPGIVYSAPMEVEVGQQASVSDLAGELLAAGYERVPTVKSKDQFSLSGDTFEIWTEPMSGPGFSVAESRVEITIGEDGVVAAVEPGPAAVLRPTVLGTVGDPEDRRTRVALDATSPYVAQAVIAMEDQRFRTHHGVDPLGVLRALVHNVSDDTGEMHGGSTITQQLAKNLFLTPERTLQRKMREMFFALALESQLDKDEILELYLQEVYLGQSGGVPLHGVDQAARAWFGVSAASLDLHEAAIIAGVISAPNTYSPRRHRERAEQRRSLVLDRMVAMDFIEPDLAEKAKKEPLVVDGVLPGAVRRAPWAFDEAVEFAERAVGTGALASRGYRVYTTIQPLLQRAAERAVRDGLHEIETEYPRAAGTEVSLVSVRASDGAVLAMIGGRDYVKSPFNRATDAWRQIGSCAKPLGMLAAFDTDSKLTPLTRLWDSPISREVDGKAWTPKNYDEAYHGEVALRQAIESSYNIPAVRLSERVGLEKLQSYTRALGLSKSTNYPSAALGAYPATAWELAGAYTVFPGGGTAREPWLVLGIADADGKELVRFEPRSIDVASARAAALSTSVLHGVITDGTGARVRGYGVQGAVAGKTGTTDDYRDAWFAGFTPEIVTAVWMGRDVGEHLGLSGSRAALPVWARYMVATGPAPAKFEMPEGIVEHSACAHSRQLSRPDCPRKYLEVFPRGAVPGTKCELHGGPAVQVKHFFGGLFKKEEEAPDPEATEAE